MLGAISQLANGPPSHDTFSRLFRQLVNQCWYRIQEKCVSSVPYGADQRRDPPLIYNHALWTALRVPFEVRRRASSMPGRSIHV